MPGRALWAPGHKAFLCPLFSDCRKQTSFPHDFPWAPVGRLELLLVRDGGGRGPGERQTVKGGYMTVPDRVTRGGFSEEVTFEQTPDVA